MFFLYQTILTLIIIISPFIILFRILKNKEHRIRYKEKFSFYSKKRVKGKLVWFHGASLGEILSIIPLISLDGSRYLLKVSLMPGAQITSENFINFT